MNRLLLPALCLFALLAPAAQEQIDIGDEAAENTGIAIKRMTVRARVTKTVPAVEKLRITWRRGGEGLGGEVTRGEFLAEEDALEIAMKQFNYSDIPMNQWTAWLPMEQVAGRAGGSVFPTIVIAEAPKLPKKVGAKRLAVEPVLIVSSTVEFEFAESGRVFKRLTEQAPKGATVSFVVPGRVLDDRGSRNPEFVRLLRGLAEHAKARREALEKVTPKDVTLPKRYAIIGHVGGYGDVNSAVSGRGVRHCDPAILADECASMRMLGINGLVGSLQQVQSAGAAEQFQRIYWGSMGGGKVDEDAPKAEPEDGCPFSPALQARLTAIGGAVEAHRTAGARESWAICGDEIGVYAKDHMAFCDRCAERFRAYLQEQKVTLGEIGAASWEDVAPFDLWGVPADLAKQTPPSSEKALKRFAAAKKAGASEPAVPKNAAESLLAYYTQRFMTYATGRVYRDATRKFKESGINVYAMEAPSPSWGGSSLDWHEFYDQDANAALVFETSNRDPRVWQWESYLSDLGRGIAARHAMPMGALIKPHRGAPAQRMLTLAARGAKVLEWYTYGPDYAKGDGFSGSPERLVQVARAAQFLGRAEDFLYDAKLAQEPQVAFVTPRSSELWMKRSEAGNAAFEDAKWVYLALAHAHVPVAILSEQQLAEGKLERFRVIYIVGPHLRRDAGAQVERWVRAGGTLWTDALGLSRDEANQPAAALREMLGLGERSLEKWGSVPAYGATALGPLTETNVPAGAALEFRGAKIRAAIGREPLDVKTGEPLAKFADGKVALSSHAHGRGKVLVAGLWAGVTYSAKVRRADYDMHADYDPVIRALIANPALEQRLAPVEVSDPQVEAVLLENNGRLGVALMNWAYVSATGKSSILPSEGLRLIFPADRKITKARSQVLGELPVRDNTIVVPKLEEIDLLLID